MNHKWNGKYNHKVTLLNTCIYKNNYKEKEIIKCKVIIQLLEGRKYRQYDDYLKIIITKVIKFFFIKILLI